MFFLTTGFVILFAISMLITNGDIFRPSVIVLAVMVAASISACYLEQVWKFTLLPITAFLLLLSVSIIIFVDFWCYSTTRNRRTNKGIYNGCLETIDVKKGIIFLVIIFDIVTFYMHYKYLIDAVGGGSIFSMATTYRMLTVAETLKSSMPSLLSRFIRLDQNFAFIFLYIGINNIIIKRKLKGNILYFIPVALYMLDSLLTGARGYLMYIVFAALIYSYFIMQRKTGWTYSVSRKYIKIVCVVGIVGAIIFTLIGGSLGRTQNASLLLLISRYLGGGIALFNDFLSGNPSHSNSFGAATFVTLYNFLSRRLGIDNPSLEYTQFEFRYSQGTNWGNVYTPLRRYYTDFGAYGVLILSALFALFFAVYYARLKKGQGPTNKVDFSLLYYGYFARSLFLFFFDDRLFYEFCTPSLIIYIIECYLCLIIVVSGQIPFKFKRHSFLKARIDL